MYMNIVTIQSEYSVYVRCMCCSNYRKNRMCFVLHVHVPALNCMSFFMQPQLRILCVLKQFWHLEWDSGSDPEDILNY